MPLAPLQLFSSPPPRQGERVWGGEEEEDVLSEVLADLDVRIGRPQGGSIDYVSDIHQTLPWRGIRLSMNGNREEGGWLGCGSQCDRLVAWLVVIRCLRSPEKVYNHCLRFLQSC